MNPLRSIRGRLTLGVITAALAIFFISGSFIYHNTKTETFAQIDQALVGHATLLSRQVEFEHGTVKLEHGDRFQTDALGDALVAFKIWTNDGQFVTGYPQYDETIFPNFASQASADSPPSFRKLTVRGHGTVRAVSMRFEPMYQKKVNNPPPPSRTYADIAVAHDISEAMAGLEQLLWLLITVGAVAFCILALLIHFLIRGALRPLEAVRNELTSRQNSNLAADIGGETALPTELQPVVAGFNSLLRRIRRVSEREREFTSSAAHELRTPLAALTSTLENSASRQRSREELVHAIDVSLETTRDMNVLVECLLSLARYDRPGIEIEVANVPLGMLVEGAVETFSAAAADRKLDIVRDLPEGIEITTDPALAQVVINNLVENAVNYASENTPIRISASNGDGRVHLSVNNEVETDITTDVEKVFEPFWRADQVRSHPGLHAGLGLSICQKIVDVIDGTITARAEGSGSFCVTVDLPAATRN
ncbi:MAG: signal transduction histidine kinase [Verrucomicrobiales bacterium]|jgi:signal transduction histidine kinase